jgi:methylenetetrahydrofolate dehydrogenase (NADP+)/methenyltetrahydrofolate cyclohydrolase
MILLDGKKTSEDLFNELKLELIGIQSSRPNIDIILVGNDPASKKYVEMKQHKANELGIGGQIYELESTASTDKIVNLIKKLNSNPQTTALMVQLPLPPSVNSEKVLESIDPKKDADGLTSVNLGLLFQKNSHAIAPATALGVLQLLKRYHIDLDGKNAVIIGRGKEVGIPIAALLLSENSTVTVCHSHTKNLKESCQKADILISSVGKKNFITKEMIKPGAVVIDVGLSLDPVTQKLVGDVDFGEVSKVAAFITPVPGGTGPMTIAALLFNTVQIWKQNLKNC